MKKIVKNLVRSGPLVLGLVLLSLLLGCSSSGYGNPKTSAATTVAAPVGSAVNISGFAFSPASITIKVGQTVTWTNKDSTAHTITSDNGVFDSGNVPSSNTYSYTFTKAGTFPYHCNIHSSMKGTVIVQ